MSRVVAFTRALILRPSLGEHVHDVTVQPSDDHRFLQAPPTLSPEDRELFASTIRDFQLGDEESTWMSAMEKVDYSLFVTLLISRTPNLRRLDLCGGQFFMKPLRQIFQRNPAVLCNLEDLCLNGDDLFAGYPLPFYEELLVLPRLKSLTAEYCQLLGAKFPASWAPQTMAFEWIDLNMCHLDAPGLKKLLQACRKVMSFSYTRFSVDPADQPDIVPATREFNAAEWHKALLPHKDTLVYLELAFTRDPWERENIQEYLARQARIGSLRNFSVLTSLSIQQALLPPRPEFPPALEQLVVEDCNVSVRELAQHLAKECRQGHLPALKSIKMLAVDITDPIQLHGQQIPPGKTPQQCFLSIRDFFKNTSVEFDILPYPDCRQHQIGDSSDEDYDDELYMDDEYDFPPLGLSAGSAPIPRDLFGAMLLQAMHEQATGMDEASDHSWVTDDEDD
ncbi:hypothetical protein BO94DRAFT_459131 [Aspergillus sclerotioniger CBS 115572]|uniref:F-box domain-containing protein n=1 Tax=Aspergillus sclerotioniger CBS 115572 TaxID=1450535 RepID=A0A317X9R3_9EURO|nr:hypothetical protein BO94DRAFT_459131 [Aspergillus sclerotioniger CBS 115572]PWY94367.1 hypothetical protein BO94DRAFT_459131 [Aspergillus sclerotioniger CBS 115572]